MPYPVFELQTLSNHSVLAEKMDLTFLPKHLREELEVGGRLTATNSKLGIARDLGPVMHSGHRILS